MNRLSYEELLKELEGIKEGLDNHEARLIMLEQYPIRIPVPAGKLFESHAQPSESQVQSLRASVINLSKKLFTHFKEHKDSAGKKGTKYIYNTIRKDESVENSHTE